MGWNSWIYSQFNWAWNTAQIGYHLYGFTPILSSISCPVEFDQSNCWEFLTTFTENSLLGIPHYFYWEFLTTFTGNSSLLLLGILHWEFCTTFTGNSSLLLLGIPHYFYWKFFTGNSSLLLLGIPHYFYWEFLTFTGNSSLLLLGIPHYFCWEFFTASLEINARSNSTDRSNSTGGIEFDPPSNWVEITGMIPNSIRQVTNVIAVNFHPFDQYLMPGRIRPVELHIRPGMKYCSKWE